MMVNRTKNLAWFAILALQLLVVTNCIAAEEEPPAVQVKGEFSIMILGSGGPAPLASGRASSGYLIFTDGQPRILMDVGGGTFQRLAASGVNIKDLDLVLLSHLHIDHTADLSAFIKGLYFQNRSAGTLRTAPIRVYGPGANKAKFPGTNILQYPSTMEYIHNHYDKEVGTERYLNIFAKAISGGTFGYKAYDIKVDVKQPVSKILDENGLVVKAVSVIHGPAPALAYRIEYKGKSIVFSGDTSSKTNNMVHIAKNADLLIYDTAIMDTLPNKGPADKVFFALHTTPTRLGEVAAAAKPKRLVLSHLTGITEPRTDEIKKIIVDKGYKGNIVVAEDLAVFNLK
jgi:ribonuclease BN (tRNA processing enzyme)